MKKLLLATIASTAFMTSSAFAQSNTDSTTVDVTANVQEECSIEDPSAVTFDVDINEGAGANALLLQNGSQTDSQNIYVSCNYTTSISATSANDGLLNAAGASVAANDPDDFTNKIEYRVLLNSTDGSYPNLDFRTRLEASDSVTAGGAFHDDSLLRIMIDRDDTQKRPVAGTYTDTATITLGPI